MNTGNLFKLKKDFQLNIGLSAVARESCCGFFLYNAKGVLTKHREYSYQTQRAFLPNGKSILTKHKERSYQTARVFLLNTKSVLTKRQERSYKLLLKF